MTLALISKTYKYYKNDMEKILSQGNSMSETQAALNRLFRSLRAVVHFQKTEKLAEGVFSVGGEFDPNEDEEDKISIFVAVHYNSLEDNFPSEWVDRMCKLVSITMDHECIHRYQFRIRDYEYLADYRDPDAEKRYLGCQDEIYAFADTIAKESLIEMGDWSSVTTSLRSGDLCNTHLDYKIYTKLFSNTDAKVLNKLRKNIYKVLMKAREHAI